MNNLRRLNSCVTNMLVSYNGIKLNRTVSLNICRHFFSRGVGEDAKTNSQKSFEREPILHLIKKWKLNISLAENYPVFKPGPDLKAAAQKYFNQLWKTKTRTISLTDLSELPETTSPEVLCLGLYLPLKVRLKLREIMKTVGTKGQRNRDYQYYDLKEGKFENPFEHAKLEKDEIFASRFRVDDTLMVTWLKKPPHETDIEEYKKHFESFVRGRKTLCRAIVTVCGQRGMTDVTTADLEILESAQVPYALVITALDGKEIFLIKTLVSVVEYIKNNPSEYCFPDPFLVQPVKNIGLDRIHSFILQEAGLIK